MNRRMASMQKREGRGQRKGRGFVEKDEARSRNVALDCRESFRVREGRKGGMVDVTISETDQGTAVDFSVVNNVGHKRNLNLVGYATHPSESATECKVANVKDRESKRKKSKFCRTSAKFSRDGLSEGGAQSFAYFQDCICNGHAAVLQALLQRDQDHPNQSTSNNLLTSLLHLAVQVAPENSCKRICEVLLRAGARIVSDYSMQSSLIAAVHRTKKKPCFLDVVEMLIQQSGASLEWADSEGMSALHHAIKLDNVEITKLLLHHNKLPLSRTHNRVIVPAHAYAIGMGRFFHVKTMLEALPGLEVENPDFLTLLLDAVWEGSLDKCPEQAIKLLALLLNHGGAKLRYNWAITNSSCRLNLRLPVVKDSLQYKVIQVLWLYKYVSVNQKICCVLHHGNLMPLAHVQWSKASHYLFPESFKRTVRDLLLCFQNLLHSCGYKEWMSLKIVLPLFVWMHAYDDWLQC